ncbi:hypothetical protein BDW59DRAFT_155210 [Aspergillus cavernicola]|uniref:Zn(2)-C6 fungal-type domain-containing protein n=1 Tax=Aspergillus cavernicola TaxID=176166 RepID=A0ABR4HB27_9EURO
MSLMLTRRSGGEGTRRRRRVYACDSCYKKKIKCDGSQPRCDWCHHHSISCTYTRNLAPPYSNKAPRLNSTPPASDTSASIKQEPHHPTTSYATLGPQAVAPDGFGCDISFAGQSLGNIGGFNGLPVFSSGGIRWIKARTGEDVSLDWYHTGRPTRLATDDTNSHGTQHISLPHIDHLCTQLHLFKSSVCYQLFPFVNPACFEYTIRAAYHQELSDISPGSSSAKSCVFAFMAMSSFFSGFPHQKAMVDADKYAREAEDLLFGVFKESITLDGLQALLMLCFCCQAISADILRIELLLSAAARYIFHLKGSIYPRDTDGDPLRTKLHVRNLFWIAFSLDKILGLRTGIQPIFDPSSCDLTLPDFHEAGNTMFHTFIRLSLLQSEIHRGLYSIPALQKSDAELLATIRSLDSALEDWRSSVPTFATDPDTESHMADFIFEMQYHYCMAAIHQTSSRCTAWVVNQDTRAAGSSLAVSISASRSVLNKFLETKPQLLGHFLMFCLPELTVSTTHLFSNILMNPLENCSEEDLSLMKAALRHVGKHLWQQVPESFTAQVRLVERFMGDMHGLAGCAIHKALRERVSG